LKVEPDWPLPGKAGAIGVRRRRGGEIQEFNAKDTKEGKEGKGARCAPENRLESRELTGAERRFVSFPSFVSFVFPL